MSWEEDTEANIVQNNMDSQEDTADLERESATEDSGLNSIGPEDTRVNLEGTETSEYAPLGDAGPNVYRKAQKHNLSEDLLLKPRPPMDISHSQETWMKRRKTQLSGKKSKYFSAPNDIPCPQKKQRTQKCRKDLTKSQATGSNLDHHYPPAEMLSVEDEVEMLWTKPSDLRSDLVVAILRSPDHKQEYLLHHSAFQTLRPHDWLFGETIECYLRAILNAKGASAKLYQLSHYTTGVILNGTREQLAQQRLRKVNFEQYDGVIAAVNVNNVHWRFVYVHAVSQQIFVLDPQFGNNEKEAATQACKKFGEFFKMRRNRDSIEDWVDTKWQPGTIDHTFQDDGYSCGVFVMQMARQVVENFPKIPESIDIDPSKDWMWNCRRNMAKDILLASVSREEYCSVCGQKPKLNKDEIWPSRTVVVRFMEFEATVPGITAKVQSALNSEEPLILTDAQGNQIVESEGTKGSLYWKQNARKILAVSEEEFQRFQQESKRKRPSQRDDGSSGLQDVFERIEEVVLAAQGLQEVTSVMKELSDVASSNRRTTLVMTNSQAQQLQTAFNCHVCKGPFQEQSVAGALWDAKYVCCNGMKLLASVLNVDKSAPMFMKSQAFLMHYLF
ncbi:hypothetical protein G5714_004300 [Onychostoma macrolepis]|uniref:Ubiquitin-like protease family profile domain-containing protein n=1 Tax=Onychostoma macrolepis TaxID=369639 RepID=A0A7J6D4E0_9TELE|nr:hypothetical protein G5714_004300 [Onychostoma macrolepis]